MSLPTSQRRALNRIEKTLAADHTGLGPLFAIFTRLTSHEAMPLTERVTARQWQWQWQRQRRMRPGVAVVVGLAMATGALHTLSLMAHPARRRAPRARSPPPRRTRGSRPGASPSARPSRTSSAERAKPGPERTEQRTDIAIIRYETHSAALWVSPLPGRSGRVALSRCGRASQALTAASLLQTPGRRKPLGTVLARKTPREDRATMTTAPDHPCHADRPRPGRCHGGRPRPPTPPRSASARWRCRYGRRACSAAGRATTEVKITLTVLRLLRGVGPARHSSATHGRPSPSPRWWG